MTFKISTDETNPQGFAPHGKFEFEILDEANELLHIKGYGPFNKELVAAIYEVQRHPKLRNPNRKEIIEFFDNCLGVEEFVTAISEYVVDLKKTNTAPKAVALIMPRNFGGFSMMKTRYVNIYKNAGIGIAIVESFDDAKQWLNQSP